MDKRRLSIYLVIGFLIGSAGFAVAAHLANTSTVTDGVTVSSPDGMTVNITGETQVQMEQMFPDSQTVELTTEDGNVTFSSNGLADAVIHKDDITGTWTTVSGLDTDINDITINPEDKSSVTVGGEINSIQFRDATLDDGNTDFSYTASGSATVEITSAPANTQIAAIDADSNELLDTATSDGSGEATFTNLDSGDRDVTLLNKDDATSPTFANADPTAETTSPPDEISVDVNDGDFPHDRVNVSIDFEGTEIHSETITSNGTVTTTNFTANQLGQTYSWSVEAEDEYTNTNSDSYSFSLPSNVTFRNETRPTEVITGANATVTFYTVDGERVITREDSNQDGRISLQGLPNTEFVVTVEVDGFYERRVYVESIFEQNEVFLLNSTAYPDAIFSEFELNDRTGNFPPGETTLRVQRALDIDGNNESEWRTVAGDYFGATNRFPFTGQYQTRYRLVVENEEGDRRVLGSFTPTVDGIQPVPIGEVTFSSELENGMSLQTTLNEQNGHNYLEVRYLDTAESTDSLTYNIVRSDNESQVIMANTTETDIDREYVALHNMSYLDPTAAEDQGYKINYYIDREGNVSSGSTYAGDVMNLNFPLDTDVQSLLAWVFIVAFAGITALYSPKMSMLTTPIVAFAFTITGIMNIPSVLLALALVEGGLIYFGDTTSPR